MVGMVMLPVNEIIEKLQGYERVDNISMVPLNTHIRYFVKMPNGGQSFRFGGFLIDKQNPEKYIILTNGKESWSVQTNTSILFKKMNRDEEIYFIHRQYQKILNEKYH